MKSLAKVSVFVFLAVSIFTFLTGTVVQFGSIASGADAGKGFATLLEKATAKPSYCVGLSDQQVLDMLMDVDPVGQDIAATCLGLE